MKWFNGLDNEERFQFTLLGIALLLIITVVPILVINFGILKTLSVLVIAFVAIYVAVISIPYLIIALFTIGLAYIMVMPWN